MSVTFDFVGRRETVMMSAAAVVPLIIDRLRPDSALDIGCGKGEWVYELRRAGVDAHGVDIEAPDGPLFLRHDLTEPLLLDREFDMVLCLETGEHLPEDAADTMVETIVQHAPAVVFSAAVPGQEGNGHINCQPHEYWHEKFAEYGYGISDPFRPVLEGNPRVSPWYQNNMFLYSERDGFRLG